MVDKEQTDLSIETDTYIVFKVDNVQCTCT